MYYTKENLKDYLSNFDIKKIKTKSKNCIKYYNIPCTFDIEVSSTYHDNKTNKTLKAKDIAIMKENQGLNFDTERYTKFSFMYIWMLSIDDKIIIGRTWEDFHIVIDSIVDYFNLGDDYKMIIYVRNLAFEFNFIKSHFNFTKVFATDSHKIIYGNTDNGFVFKCSYFLSGCSLETTGKNLMKYKSNKMVGDLDYDLIRTSITPLTDKEIGYCLNDVIVDSNFIRESMENEKGGSILKLPLTKTGYVRRYCKKYCLNEDNRLLYSRIISNFEMNDKHYNQLKRAYTGAFTHANAVNVGLVFKNVNSDDFTSSYPAVLLMEKFPISRPYDYEIKNGKDFVHQLLNYCCLFDVTFFNIRMKDEVYENIISESKCFNIKGQEVNNGRVVKADELSITLTEVDFLNIREFYKFDSIRISNFKRYKKGYLPKPLIECIIKFYKDKTILKDVKGKENEYQLGKSMLNAIYGMMVTDPIKDTYEIDDDNEWKCENANIEESLEHYNKSNNRFIAYEWGIWCTAYARRNLFTAIKELGADFIYADTDSVKYTNRNNHLRYFNRYNEIVVNKLNSMCSFYNIPFEDVSPKTVKGISKTIGLWDYEGTYESFKTLGAKRYAYVKNGKFNITVSGISKQKAVPYLIETANKRNIDVFDLFDNELIVDCEHCGKLLHTYIDTKLKFTVIDYLGNKSIVEELSSVHLEPTSYSLDLNDAYVKYFMNVRTKYYRNC